MRELRRRGWRVALFSLVPPAEPEGLSSHLAEAADEVRLVQHRLGPRGRGIRLARALLSRRAFQEDWFWLPGPALECADWLRESTDDVLFVEQLYMLRYVPSDLRHRVVLDTQNLEVARMRAMRSAGSGALRRTAAAFQIGSVRRYEEASVRSVARVLAVSPEEASAFERMAPGRVRLVPNGVDARGIVPMDEPPASRRLLYMGSMGYAPNVDAVSHFVARVAPLLRSGGLSLDVVGSNPPRSVRAAASSAVIKVRVSGFVRSVEPYYRSSRAMVVPLRHGGGTRLKILEALAWGLPVVTTSVGCAGLGLVAEREALIADTPAQFAAAVDRLVIDDALWMRLSRAGRSFVEKGFDWSAIGGVLEGVMTELVVPA